ncbi:uncharacterized protein TrAtP1_008259 [Trichoderma atroviride]|uniref:uncharacterized protein n=1 Tax=Hypocrea atroviridis TaxID=63577 RepID=UPI003323B207|nr:hypothetical protein TrAtP1_008259 [Trichoderma atroviride]
MCLSQAAVGALTNARATTEPTSGVLLQTTTLVAPQRPSLASLAIRAAAALSPPYRSPFSESALAFSRMATLASPLSTLRNASVRAAASHPGDVSFEGQTPTPRYSAVCAYR